MANAEEALRKMREICLALPVTREGSHFGKAAFYVKGKLFATCEESDDSSEITFGLEPDEAAALVKSDPRFKPYPRDRRGVVLDAAKVKTWSEVKTLVLKSYALVNPVAAKSRTKKSAPGMRTKR